MFKILKDFDRLESAVKRYYYYITEIEKGNIEFEEKRIAQHKKIAEILECEPEMCTSVLHNLKTIEIGWELSPTGAAQILAELKIHGLLDEI